MRVTGELEEGGFAVAFITRGDPLEAEVTCYPAHGDPFEVLAWDGRSPREYGFDAMEAQIALHDDGWEMTGDWTWDGQRWGVVVQRRRKSSCCGRNVSVAGRTTRYHVCNGCGKACDVTVLLYSFS